MAEQMVMRAVGRGLLGMSVALLLFAAAPTEAAGAKRSCKLIKDAEGDATDFYGLGEGTAPYTPALDVLSADLAATGETFATVVRVAELPALPVDPQSPGGNQWFILFTIGSNTFFVDARSTPTGNSFFLYKQQPLPSTGEPLGPLKGVIDQAKNEVRVSGPLTLLGPPEEVRIGTEVHSLEVLSARFVGVVARDSADTPGLSFHADFTSPGKTYRIGTPSCLKVDA